MLVVTGADGHVGNVVVRALLAAGERPVAWTFGELARRSLAGLDVPRLTVDVRDAAAVHAALAGARVVIHLAGHIAIDPAGDRLVEPVNLGGTRHVVAACLAHGARLFHMSTAHALDADHPGARPISETQPLLTPGADAMPYDLSKAEAERVVLAAVARGLDAVILSPSAVIGPDDYGPSHFAQRFGTLMTSPVAVAGGYNFVDVRDVASAVVAALTRARRGERYLLPGHQVSARHLAELITEVGGTRPPWLTVPLWAMRLGLPLVEALARATRRPPFYNRHILRILEAASDFSHAKAQRELGFSPRPLRQSLADACAFYRAAGYLPPGPPMPRQ